MAFNCNPCSYCFEFVSTMSSVVYQGSIDLKGLAKTKFRNNLPLCSKEQKGINYSIKFPVNLFFFFDTFGSIETKIPICRYSTSMLHE